MYIQLNTENMSLMKFALLWFTLTVVILIGWPLGFALGNAMMQTSSPQLSSGDATATALIFATVTAVNALLQAFFSGPQPVSKARQNGYAWSSFCSACNTC